MGVAAYHVSTRGIVAREVCGVKGYLSCPVLFPPSILSCRLIQFPLYHRYPSWFDASSPLRWDSWRLDGWLFPACPDPDQLALSGLGRPSATGRSLTMGRRLSRAFVWTRARGGGLGVGGEWAGGLVYFLQLGRV